jgi:hypothetical protein
MKTDGSTTMTDEKICALLNILGPLPTDADFEQVREFVDRSLLEPDEKKILLVHLTQPILRLIWAQLPEAGHDCVQTVEVRLPSTLKGLHPRLHVRFPDTLQRLCGSEPTAASDGLLGTTTADRKSWALLDLQQYTAPEHVWRADMQFRLPRDLRGTYLWTFCIDFLSGWGHTELHRLFEAQYKASFGSDNQGQTTLTIDAKEFSVISLPPDLSKWKNVTVISSGNAIVRTSSVPPDYSALYGGSNPYAATDSNAAIFNPLILHKTLPGGSSRTLVVTPHTPSKSKSDSIRSSWPGVLTADLHVTSGSPAGTVRTIRLHAAKELRLGRRKKYTDKSGKTHFNHIVTDFVPEDYPELSHEQLKQRRAAISAMNCVLTISADALMIRNTGSPLSDFPGYTEVEYQVGERSISVAVEKRDDEQPIDGVRENKVTAVQLRVGGSPAADGDPILGYPMQLIPVPDAVDNTDTNPLQKPEDYSELLGELPKLSQEVRKHGMDAVLIKHGVQREQPLPLHVMLLRQLWLGTDGLPLEDQKFRKFSEAATARVLISSVPSSRQRIFFLQPLQEDRMLLVHSSTHKQPMRVQPRSLVPLHHGDRLQLMKNATTPLWEAEVSMISEEDA